MKKLLSILLAVALVVSFSLVTTVPALAVTTYYVATDGSDAFGDGSETWIDNDSSGDWSAGDTGPWLTIQHAIDQCAGGEAVQVAEGTYGPFTVDTKSDLTITAGGDVTIEGAQQDVAVFYKTPADLVVFVKDSTNITLAGLTIQGSGLADGSGEAIVHGILYQASTGLVAGCRVSPNTVGNMYTLAVAIISTAFEEGAISDVTLNQCRIDNYGRVGVYIRGVANILESSIEGPVYPDEGKVCYGVEVEQIVPSEEPTASSTVNIYHTEIYNNDNTFSPAPTWDSDGVLINGWLEYYPQADCVVMIDECDIHDNYGGIYAVKSSNSYVHGSNIHDNRTWGVNSPPAYDASTAWFDAENNWWGTENGPTHADNTYNVGMQGDVASDFVDYVPWIGSTGGSFAPVTSVDGDFSSIQAAIDAATGTIINAAAGTYTESVVVLPDKDNLQLIGAGSSETFIAPTCGRPVLLEGWSLLSECPLDGFRLQGFTLVTPDDSHAFLAGSGTPDGTTYTTNLELEDVVVNGGERGICLNAVGGVSLTGVQLSNISGSGEGALELTGVSDLLFTGGSIVGNDIGVRLQISPGPWGDYGPNGNIQIHFSSFCGNGVAIENQDSGTVIDATNNWWCHASGPHASPGYGDPVSGDVTYDPWLLEPIVPGEPLPATYDETLTLLIGWTLVSTDNWIDPAETVGEGVILAYNYTPSLGYFEVTPADLVPVNALYLKTEDGGALGITYSGGVPVVSSKNLEAGWNLVSSATETDAKAVLSPLRFVQVGEEQGIGLTTVVSQGDYNLHTADFYLATLTDSDWNALGAVVLNPFDGYWIYMNAPKVFGVVPD